MFSQLLGRLLEGESRPKIADEVCISNAYFSYLLSGARRPSRELIIRLAKALNTPACDMLTEAGHPIEGCMLLIRGLPGSGKSTMAKLLLRTLAPGAVHLEADMYHMVNGQYCFDPSRIADAHQWCKDKVIEALKLDRKVIVSNTFTQHWEMAPYYAMAKQYHVPFEVIEAKGSYGTIHNVPADIVEKMINRWEELNMEDIVTHEV